MNKRNKIIVDRLSEKKDKIKEKIKLLLGRVRDIDTVIRLILEREIKDGINKNK